MYRQYEDPRALEKKLEETKQVYEMALNECNSENERYDVIEMYEQKIADLEERINFAWQDEEFG